MSATVTTIDASPTKDFFIKMLVKDISLIQVIPDLVDNCVDGARRLRSDEIFNGLSIRIEANNEMFKISDNCGGISVELARDYAFRFGRPTGMPNDLQVPHSTGQFGIGMKRAIFKLGSHFKIVSKTSDSHFVIDENVEDWAKNPKWEFEFAELKDNLSESIPTDERGTTLVVSPLHDNVAEDFGSETFISRVKVELESKHQETMKKGLTITLNGIPLITRISKLLHSSDLKPANREIVIEAKDRPDVNVRMWAGVSESNQASCGWHVFCNGRLILEADKTQTTGWGDGNPRYHPQFNRFRGYVFFDSDDVSLLPWNTTKDGVDADSPTYRAVRLKMIEMMRPVIDFLNQLKEEKEETDEGTLGNAVNDATLFNLSAFTESSNDISISKTFVAPKPEPAPPKPEYTNIHYVKPKIQVAQVKNTLGVKTNTDVGKFTFDYYYELECED